MATPPGGGGGAPPGGGGAPTPTDVDLAQRLQEILERTNKSIIKNVEETANFIAGLESTVRTLDDGLAKTQATLELQSSRNQLEIEALEIAKKITIEGNTQLEQQLEDRIAVADATNGEKERLLNIQQIVEANKNNADKLILQLNSLKNQQTAREKNLKLARSENTESAKLVGIIDDIKAKLEIIKTDKLAAFRFVDQTVGAMAFNSVLKSIKQQILGIDQAQADFNKRFGFGEQYTDRIKSTTFALNEYGVTAKDVGQAQEALIKSFTDFVALDPQIQAALEEQVILSSKLGITFQTNAAALQNFTKIYGVGTEDLNDALLQTSAVARDLGFEQEEFFQKLNASRGELAKFGSEGPAIFNKLMFAVKVTGFEMEKILNFAKQFDTFEGAATQAGKLNAALGGNFVNAMDLMMTTDPVDRFKMIGEALQSTGVAFEDMGYYQKQFIAQSAGLSDPAELALIMNGRFDLLSDSIQASEESIVNQREAARAAMSVTEKFNAMVANNAETFEHIATKVLDFTKMLLNNLETVKFVIMILVSLKVAMIALGVANAFASASAAPLAAGVLVLVGAFFLLQDALDMHSPSKLVIALFAMSAAFGALMVAMSKMAVPLAKVGFGMRMFGKGVADIGRAFLMLGLGIAIASVGLSFLVKSFKDLGDAAMPAAIAVGVFTVAFLALVGVLMSLVAGPQAALAAGAVGVLLSVGGAALMIGGAVAIAAYGMSLLVESFGGLFEAAPPGDVLLLAAAMGAIAGIALLMGSPLGLAGVVGFGIIAAGITALGLAIRSMPSEDLKYFSELTSSLVELSMVADKLTIVADKIKDIGDAVKNLPETKAMTVTAMMSATRAASAGATNNTNNIVAAGNTKQVVELYIGREKIDSIILDTIARESQNYRNRQ